MQNQVKIENEGQKPDMQDQQKNDHNQQHHSQQQHPRSQSSSPSKSGSSPISSKSQYSDDHSHISNPDQQQPLVKLAEGEGAVKKQNQQIQSQRRIRYKYCCKICKHTDKSKKACVCVVPKGQRRTQIGQQGCQTCGCNGCSKEDFISRGQDPQYKPGQKPRRLRNNRDKDNTQFEARNGCCRKCMKAFSKSNKSCLCQVPEDVRNTKLPSSGCKICGCFGCNPEDKKDPRNRKAKKNQRERSRSRQKKKKVLRSRSQSSHSRQYIDPTSMNFYNVQKSVLAGMITNQYRLDPVIFGFGVPQRTHNYIIGKPK